MRVASSTYLVTFNHTFVENSLAVSDAIREAEVWTRGRGLGGEFFCFFY